MKQLIKISLCALVLTFASCSSDSNGSSTGGASEGTITAKVDGNTVTTLQIATNATIVGPAGFQLLSITGADASGRAIYLAVTSYGGVGTYTSTTSEGPEASFTYTALDLNNPTSTNNTWIAPYEDGSTSGTMTVTEQTATKIKGTFSFTGKNFLGTTKNITNGSFNVNLSNQ